MQPLSFQRDGDIANAIKILLFKHFYFQFYSSALSLVQW